MTGGDITTIRQRLGLTVAEFATLLIVSPATAHRWEACAHHEAAVSGIHKALLVYLRDWNGDTRKLYAHLMIDGSLTALAYVLQDLVP
jgi:transcriptional regulator with XRE-family HTH domain